MAAIITRGAKNGDDEIFSRPLGKECKNTIEFFDDNETENDSCQDEKKG